MSGSRQLPDAPLSPEAAGLFDRIRPKIDQGIATILRTPVSILLWGPAPDGEHPLCSIRWQLRSRLREEGHAAFCSEELCDAAAPVSIRAQQLLQAQEFDLIVSVPVSPGSIAEVHDFAGDRRVHGKLLVFINEEDINGYGPKSLDAVRTILSCHIEYYSGVAAETTIPAVVRECVRRIRELKFILAGRGLS
jgi:hypothetical protein